MTTNLNEYVIRRMEELEVFRSETLKLLKDVTKTAEELSIEEEKEILENKMKYYSASGALAELEELKKLLGEGKFMS